MSTSYRTKHPIAVRSDTCAIALDASVLVSAGDPEFTPLAGQWILDVVISANGSDAQFYLVENMLRSFLEGHTVKQAGEELSSWEQKPAGFVLRFDPGLIESGCANDGITAKKRRYVQRVNIELAIVHSQLSIENIFAEVCQLADFAFEAWWEYLRALAPAVFTERYRFVEAVKPLMRPLQLSLGLDTSLELEKAAESLLRPLDGVSSYDDDAQPKQDVSGGEPTSKAGEGWVYCGRYFGSLKYKPRDFVVVSLDDEELCTHTPVFLEDCIKKKRRRTQELEPASQMQLQSSQRVPGLTFSSSQLPSQSQSQLQSQSQSQLQPQSLSLSQSQSQSQPFAQGYSQSGSLPYFSQQMSQMYSQMSQPSYHASIRPPKTSWNQRDIDPPFLRPESRA